MTKDLIDGLNAFKHYHYESSSELMSSLVEDGQDPRYFIVSCIDSRCNPGTIFRAKPGSFFAHKAMGAIVRPYHQGTALAAALQFAINYNNVKKVIVLGHTQCGAVKALAENLEDPEITSFVNVAKHGLARAQACCSDHEEVLARTEKEVILESTKNLKEYPSVKAALAEGKIEVLPWLFDIKTGDLFQYDEDKEDFVMISTPAPNEDSRQSE